MMDKGCSRKSATFIRTEAATGEREEEGGGELQHCCTVDQCVFDEPSFSVASASVSSRLAMTWSSR